MNKTLTLNKLTLLILSAISSATIAAPTTYTYELSELPTWTDGGTTTNTGGSVRVRSYVPGGGNNSYRNISIYTPTYASEANASGDQVGTIFNIYGSGHTAFAIPFDGARRTVIYPAIQILHTRLRAVNDDRLAIGNYNVLGGHARGRGFIYDLVYDQYTDLVAPDTEWTDLGDVNNFGEVVGTRINNNGATRTGFIYDCENKFQPFNIPGSGWTVPRKIDDDGNVYGEVTGIAGANYFVARPDFVDTERTCSLVPIDDSTDAVVFANPEKFELSGDVAVAVKIADFDNGGVNDLLVYHEPGKTILYLGESGFDDKIKYRSDEFNTLGNGITLETEWDFNNDGLIDKVKNNGLENRLSFAKEGGGYYYVPQTLPVGTLRFGDLNDDGLVDTVAFADGFASIAYQLPPSAVAITAPEPATVIPVDPVATPAAPAATSPTGIPDIDGGAYKIESKDTIKAINTDNVLLNSGKTLWFNAQSIIKFNDASGFEIGQELEFKAWANADGALIGIKVEVI